ncbi:uncharacterized protein odam isoform X3 [Girardinichthys multiradiatus]|uniref:Apin n=1 Tax=Goodea atripinnis TaxID=208336 RepID=A0ABV0MS75_9TELE|nr:uncharacterized protein odam isoform X3 [Girardinichthys multiradiatus]
MKLQSALLVICLLRSSLALPVQIGLIASNSNEILRLNGLTLAALGQAQVLNLNPQLAGPFGPQGPQLLLPNQGNPLTPMLIPNGQQEQLGPQQDPNNPNIPQQAQNPVQMYPQLQYPSFGFPQLHRQQSYSYFVPRYGFAQQRNTGVLPNNGQQNQERTTQRPQLPLQQGSKTQLQTEKTWPAGTQKESTTVPPDPRGDATGTGTDEGNGSFPFLFEP